MHLCGAFDTSVIWQEGLFELLNVFRVLYIRVLKVLGWELVGVGRCDGLVTSLPISKCG